MIFIKIKNLIEQQKEDVKFFIKKIKLENEVSNLINNKSFKIMGEVLESGYVLTDKQHDKLCKFLIENKDDVKHHELISSGYQFPTKTFKMILKKNPNLLFNKDNILTKQLFNKIKNDDSFNLELFNLWEKNILSIKKLYWSNDDKIDIQESILYYFEKNWDGFFEEKNSSKLIKSLSNIKFADFANSSDNQNSINRISNNISKKLQNNLTVKKNEIIKATKEVFLGEKVEKSISKLSENQILAFSIKKLPENIQFLIVKIEANCQKLNGVKDIEIQHVVDQTIDKLLPETLKKYSMMDDEYKTTMKNKDGKSAQDLLIESLNNMNDKLINIIHNKNENHLMEMEIGATFTKKLKNA